MRCKVELYVAGQVFTEEVRAVDYQEARQVALARNPNARVISVTADIFVRNFPLHQLSFDRAFFFSF